MPLVPLFGTGTKGKSPVVTVQRYLNLYQDKSEDRGEIVLYSRPGLLRQTNQSGSLGGPAVGVLPMYYNNNGQPVSQDYVWFARPGSWETWTSLYAGTAFTAAAGEQPPNSQRMSIAFNGIRGFAVNGSGSWYMTPNAASTAAWFQPGGSTFPWLGSTSVTFIAGRFVCNCPTNPGRFAWSPLNATIGTVWDPLAYATAESSPDALPVVREHKGILHLFGTNTIEFWQPVATTAVFQNVTGATAPWGIVATESLQELNGVLYFLGQGENGSPQVCRLQGYQVEVVSTPDVDYDLAAGSLGGATACAFTIGGHSFYVLNYDVAKPSFVFDATTGLWHEWSTDGGRWACDYVVQAFGELIGTDYRDGRTYLLSETVYKDDTSNIIREVDTRHLYQGEDRMTVWELSLLCETGTGLGVVVDPSASSSSNPMVMLQISRDGGRSFGAELWTMLGQAGAYLQRVVWRRLGRGRDFVFRIRTSEPVKITFVGGSVRAQ